MEMGFDEKEVIDALRVSNNQQSAAVSTGRTRGAACVPSAVCWVTFPCSPLLCF